MAPPSRFERLVEARSRHAARLGAAHGLLDPATLERLPELGSAELERLEPAVVQLDGALRVRRANAAALRLFRLAVSGPLAERFPAPTAGRPDVGGSPLIGRSFCAEVCPSANGPLLRGLLASEGPLTHLLPYTFVGPRGSLDALVHLHRPPETRDCWILARAR